jgi:hypothetical protein
VLKENRARFCFILGGIVFCFVTALSNETAGAMIPTMYFPLMVVSLHFTLESWLILFFVPIIGGFLGVYLALSMNHIDESEDDQEMTDIVCDKRSLRQKNILYEL